MQIDCIANPTAGRGRTEAFLRAFRESSVDAARVDVHWTERPGHATDIARACSGDVVCAIGGDGTVHEVVGGLMPSPRPLAIIPTGSGNDFASMFGCATTPEELTRILEDGVGVRTDVFETEVGYCVNSAGIGFEALVNRHSHRIRRLRGLPLYLSAVFKAMVSFDCPPFSIECDGNVAASGEKLMISVGNGVRTGGGFHLWPDAYPDDGELDLCIVEKMGRLKMLMLLPKTIPGKHTDAPAIEMKRCRNAAIRSDRPFHVHIDGEYAGMVEVLSFRLIPRCLPVLTKKDAPARVRHDVEKLL